MELLSRAAAPTDWRMIRQNVQRFPFWYRRHHRGTKRHKPAGSTLKEVTLEIVSALQQTPESGDWCVPGIPRKAETPLQQASRAETVHPRP
jgi:hypothetical protein